MTGSERSQHHHLHYRHARSGFAVMSERSRSATRRPRAGDSQSDQSDESSDASSGKHVKKRDAHGQRGSPAKVPEFMRLSGEAAASGRRSRSSSRSSSPASGVDDARAVSGEGRLSTDDIFNLASSLVRGEGGAWLSAAHAASQEDLEAYGWRCYWCLCVRSAIQTSLPLPYAGLMHLA